MEGIVVLTIFFIGLSFFVYDSAKKQKKIKNIGILVFLIIVIIINLLDYI
ncbi:hypothetical protein SAMN04487886_10103 [Clostridium sp. DSM 8431]|nr:hypothetical protein [Clostridium sp. DSM 8431]SFU34309.1 hypothetical protein SAMN04487886_10103 [Clostridium sp. DSM 8431]